MDGLKHDVHNKFYHSKAYSVKMDRKNYVYTLGLSLKVHGIKKHDVLTI